MNDQPASATETQFTFRHPDVPDGTAIWHLVREVGTLDRNSVYAYLLMCRDFADTCVVAALDGEILGFITGYRPPRRDNAVFVWQVGVSPEARGQRLASRMLDQLLLSDGCDGVNYLETTVGPSNMASRAMFASLARRLGAELTESAGFDSALFPGSEHEPEPVLRIGPFDRSVLKKTQGVQCE